MKIFLLLFIVISMSLSGFDLGHSPRQNSLRCINEMQAPDAAPFYLEKKSDNCNYSYNNNALILFIISISPNLVSKSNTSNYHIFVQQLYCLKSLSRAPPIA